MASWDRLHTAMLGGVVIGVATGSHEYQRSLVRFRYPGRDGAEIEDLGAREATFSLSVEFYDDAGDTAQGYLQQVLDLFDAAESVEYIDPHLGSLGQVRIESVRPRFDLSPDHVQAEIELIAELGGDPAFDASSGGVTNALGTFDAAMEAALASVGALS